jgi:hypothetical protein
MSQSKKKVKGQKQGAFVKRFSKGTRLRKKSMIAIELDTLEI